MTSLPIFSIVVPTYRRPECLGSCLGALASLDYPRDRFEVIVVEDGHDALAPEWRTGARHPIEVTHLTQPHAGPATARNTGAARARGDYLAFTDDDCLPDAHWLRALADQVVRAPNHVLGGRTINALTDNPYSSATQLIVDYLYEWQADHWSAAFFTANNLAVPTNLFHAGGGFHPSFTLAGGEDREFCHRWARGGGGVTYAPEAIVRHVHPLAFKSFWGQHFVYGRGARSFHRLRARSGGGPSDRKSLSFYLKLVAYPLSQAKGVRRPLSLTTLVLLAQVATAAGYYRERLHPTTSRALSPIGQRSRDRV
jgi:GT2 family glycosyltransferase